VGTRRRFEPPVDSAPVARRWRPPDAPSRQAGGRRRSIKARQTGGHRVHRVCWPNRPRRPGASAKVTASLPPPVFGMSESLVTALTIVAPFARARLPGLAEPEAVRGQRHGRRQSRRNAAAIHGPPSLPSRSRGRVDGLLMAFPGSPRRLPHLPPYLPPHHDVATLQQAKLPVSAPFNGPIRSATGVHCSAFGRAITAW
jgi:hypothetical protein